MADATYKKAIPAVWQALVDLIGGTINVVLCSSAYTPDTSSTGDEFLSSIPSGARLATATLSGKTIDDDGVFDASDTEFLAPPAGQTPHLAVIYQDASPESSARLLRKMDSLVGLDVAFSGEKVTLVWPNDANKIWKTHDA